MNQTIEIGVEHMCNLSQGVYKTAKKIATPLPKGMWLFFS